MKIILSPIRRDETLCLERQGDSLSINGTSFDFSALPEGGVLAADTLDSRWLIETIRRVNGELHLKILLPHGVNAPYETLFASEIEVIADGPVALPPYETAQPQEEQFEA